MVSFLLAVRSLERAIAAVYRDPETKALPLIAAALILTGTIFYWRFEDWTIIESFYFCVVTLATVGFGDITPVSPTARAATTLQMVGDIILVSLVVQVIVGAMRQGLRRKESQTSAASADVPEDSL